MGSCPMLHPGGSSLRPWMVKRSATAPAFTGSMLLVVLPRYALTKRTSTTGPLLKFSVGKSPRAMLHPVPVDPGATMKHGSVLVESLLAIEAWYSGFCSTLLYGVPPFGPMIWVATVLLFTVTTPGLAPPTVGSAWQPKQLKALNEGPSPTIVGVAVVLAPTVAVVEKTVNPCPQKPARLPGFAINCPAPAAGGCGGLEGG